MLPVKVARAAGTGASVPIECCQVCGHAPLTSVLSLGYMPPVNQMVPVGAAPRDWVICAINYSPPSPLFRDVRNTTMEMLYAQYLRYKRD